MIEGYAETRYKGQSIRFGYIPGLGEWVSLCDEGIFEGETSEDAVDQARKAIDEKDDKNE
ncbi:MAG: hypothetical protein IJI41_14055 [Anaerolineaceae bacterium]|nr:hypothetical protein [Anaerolineaceae bacterium]